jgi:hypothetical protein
MISAIIVTTISIILMAEDASTNIHSVTIGDEASGTNQAEASLISCHHFCQF